MTTAASATQRQASEYVKGDRGAVYGPPLVNHQRIADIWSVILGTKVTPEQAVLCMLGVKLARLVQTVDHKDTIVDIHGYCDVLEAVNEAQRLLDPEDQPASSSGVAEVKVNWHKPDPFSDWTEEEKKRGWKVMGNPTEPWKFYSDPAGTTIYADGSKDMTFEEAVGEEAPKFYGSGRNPCGQ